MIMVMVMIMIMMTMRMLMTNTMIMTMIMTLTSTGLLLNCCLSGGVSLFKITKFTRLKISWLQQGRWFPPRSLAEQELRLPGGIWWSPPELRSPDNDHFDHGDDCSCVDDDQNKSNDYDYDDHDFSRGKIPPQLQEHQELEGSLH